MGKHVQGLVRAHMEQCMRALAPVGCASAARDVHTHTLERARGRAGDTYWTKDILAAPGPSQLKRGHTIVS